MLLRLFRSHQPVVIIILPVITVLFWMRTLLHGTLPGIVIDENQMPLYELIHNLINGNSLITLITAIALVIIQSFMLNWLNSKYIFIETRSYLPPVFFILLSSCYLPMQQLHPVLFANFFLILAINKILGNVKERHLFSKYFYAGFFIALGSLFYANLVFYFIIIWISMMILRPFDWREWIISLLGLLTPFLFAVVIYFYINSLHELASTFLHNILIPNPIPDIGIFYYIFFGYLFFLLLISVFLLFSRFINKKIIARKYFSVFIWLFIVSVLVFFFVPSSSFELMILASVPASYLLSNYFITVRYNFRSELMFLLLIAIIVVIQFVK